MTVLMRNDATTTVVIGFPVGLILWEHAQMRQMVYPQSFFCEYRVYNLSISLYMNNT